ncbi:Polyisoprenyl-teichoic acid--peptidoglycan teichoic acid transferase TagU [Actinosynnema sp. ALI-1.44]
MEGSGGLSVSELLEQHSRTNIPRPVPPTDGRRPESTGRRAAPEAESTGRRAMPEPEVTGRRAAAAPDLTGRRAVPEPPQTGRRVAPEPTGRRTLPDDLAPAAPTRPEDTGRRRRPTPEDAPSHFGPESTGRRARPDLAAEHAAPRRAAEQAPPRRPADPEPPRRAAAPSLPRDTAPGAPGLPREAAPNALGSPREAAPREPSLPRDPGPRDPGLPRDPAAPRVTRRDLAATPHDASQTPPRDPATGGPRDRALRDPGRPAPRDLPPNGRPAPAGPGVAPRDTAPAAPRDAAPRDLAGGGPRDTGPRGLPGGPRETGPHSLPGGSRETGAHQIPGGPRETGAYDVPGGGPREAARDLPGGGRRDAAPAGPRDLADGSGPRRLAEPGPSDTGRRPDPRRANGADPRGYAGRPGGPDGSGPRQFAPDGPGRPANGVPGPDAGRRPADHDTGPHGVDPRRLAGGGPDTGRRPAGAGPVPEGGPNGTGPRRMPEGGPDGSGPRRMPEGGPDGSGPRRLAEGGPDAPRRLAEGGPDGSGPRRLADGAPDAPRRLAEGGPDGSGPRRLAEGGPDGSGPRRLAEGGPRRLAGGGPDVAAAEGGDIAGRLGGAPAATPPAPAAPTPRDQIDPLSLTTEMEAISDDVKKRREVDHTLARFSAVHDELAEQERQKKERRQKLLPWKQDHDEDATVFAEPLDDADDSDVPRRRRARTAKHSKIVRTVKVLSLTGAVLVFVATGLGWGAMQYIDSKFTEIDALNTNSAAVHEAEKQLGDENFLIVGSDTRAGAKPEDGVGDADKEPGARSDVLMLAHIPADRKRVVVVSVPRDLEITRPECEKWDWKTGEYTGEKLPKAKGVKANTAYADGGPRCVSTFMTELTGLTINHFISVDFNGFKGMVDAVGKIKVCVPKVMEDEELGVIFDKPGQYEIDGEKALDYVRARKVTNEPLGDYDRVKRQQKFLSSLLRTALSSEMLLNPGKLNNFLNAFASSTVGQNIGVKDMLTLAQSLQGIEAGRVSFVTVPHRTDEGLTKSNHDNIELLLEDETKALFQAIIDGTPLPGETPDANPTTPTQSAPTSNAPAQPKQGRVIDPKGLKIQVFNGEGGRDGAAKLAKDNLEELGFTVVNWGGGEATPKTVIRYGIGGEDAAATLAAAVPGATPEFRPEMGGSVLLLLGPEWDRRVVAPQPGGTAGQPGKTTPPPVEVVNAGVDPCA